MEGSARIMSRPEDHIPDTEWMTPSWAEDVGVISPSKKKGKPLVSKEEVEKIDRERVRENEISLNMETEAGVRSALQF